MWPFTRSRLQVRILYSTEIRLEQWQRSAELVAQARRIFALPEFRAMLDCLRTESPANYSLPLTGVTREDRETHALHIEGYNLALNNLEAMARLNEKGPALEATFEPERSIPAIAAVPAEP